MKYLILNIVLIIFCNVISSQTILSAGDIAITGVNADNPDEFTFVLLTDIEANTQINFTDNGWQSSGSFRTGEGVITWTTITDLSCGTEIQILDNANPFVSSIGSVTDSAQFALATSGDQILAYQGDFTSPTFLYAIHFANGAGWTDATNPQSSAVPTGLTDGINAVYIGDFDNGRYICTVTNESSLILAAISTDTNWNGNNIRIVTLGNCTYNCCLSSVTWSGVWTPATGPDTSTEVVINTDYNTATDGGSFDACRLIVNVGSTLTISDGDYVNVISNIIIDGTILVANEGSLVQVNDAAYVSLGASGNGILQKTANPQEFYSYTYWSSAFVNEIIGEAGSGLDLVPTNRIFQYDAANFEDTDLDGFDDDSNDWNIASGPMEPGRGYAAFAQNNGIPFPQIQSYSFDGEFNNGIITIEAQESASGADPNWNLLGNPYPSGISASSFITANTDLYGTIYLWTHNSPPDSINPGPYALNFSVADYASYTPGSGGVAAGTGGPIPTGIIASGQGFFIEAVNSERVIFNNSMRVTTGNDDFFLRAKDRVWVNIESNHGSFSQILITFSENATNGFDRLYDGKRLDAGSYISLFSMIEDQRLAIQGRATITEEEVIPIGYNNLAEGENEYKISIDNVEGIIQNSEIYLIDNFLGVTHNLNSSEYRFTSAQGEFRERFELQLLNTIPEEKVEVIEDLIITENDDNSLSFSTTNNVDLSNIKVFDTLGRLIYNINILQEGRVTYNMNDLYNSIFIVRATLVNGNIINKKVIR